MCRVKDAAALLSVVSSSKDTIIIFAGTRSSMPLQKKMKKKAMITVLKKAERIKLCLNSTMIINLPLCSTN